MMGVFIEGMEMPKTNVMLLIEPDGKVWEMGDLLGDDKLLDGVKAIPIADVRPVVLCRDCYAYRRDNELAEAAYLDPKMYCGLLRCEMGEDSFCSYGKRKEET